MSVKIFVIICLMAFQPLIVQNSRVKRVVGGTTISCGTEPQVASLRNATTDRHLCGSLLVTPRFALTAAHCVSYAANQYLLQLNNYCVDDDENYPQAQVQDIITHPKYDKVSGAHDISILKIHLNMKNTRWIDSSVLPQSSFGVSGECTIYGYGYKESNDTKTYEKLSAAQVKILSLDDCKQILGDYIAPQYDSGMLCALGDSTDACQGDSGGPVMCNQKVQGICSYGIMCGVNGVPGVYTSIGPHLSWIRKTMGLL